MYYRRKIILAILQRFGNKLGRTDFQKYLFLYSQGQEIKHFDFVPYKFGCFSFQSYADNRAMIKYGQIEESEIALIKTDATDYISQLKLDDQIALEELYDGYGSKRGDDLLKLVYNKFPYYATKSEVASRILNHKEFEIVNQLKPKYTEKKLFTIGYENKSIDTFLNQLYKNNISLLCDVRRNPKSMKYGFSKNQLSEHLERIGIQYLHFPELGIASDERKQAASYGAWTQLFNDYSKHISQSEVKSLNRIIDLLDSNNRIALMCFESDYCACHRHKLSQAIIHQGKLNDLVVNL
jgi:uncharacterized protein (DUF488 family)